MCKHVTKQITRYSGVILSRNTCRNIGSNAFEKKSSRVCFRQKKLEKSFSPDWAENLAESNMEQWLIELKPVERAAKRRMRPVGFHINI